MAWIIAATGLVNLDNVAEIRIHSDTDLSLISSTDDRIDYIEFDTTKDRDLNFRKITNAIDKGKSNVIGPKSALDAVLA